MHKYRKVIFLMTLTLFFSGCMSTAQHKRTVSQSADPAVRVSTMTAQLRQQGVQVIEVGETVAVVIPSDSLFQGDSANLDPSSFYRLNKIADFLRLYPKTFVEVRGHTDLSTDENRAKLLTSRQAAHVVHYLWTKGVDSRMMNAVGYGSSACLVDNFSLFGNAKNRRIEIYFQYDK